ncbi:MAG: hypothetical protein JWO95_680 [Verrucomicrobiales bacterium]|nr:hypothetical protein [Verrucomicrobiales bacterium]
MKLTRFYLPTLVLLLSLLVGCKPSHDISGAWFGTLDAGHLKLRLVFHIKHHGGSYEATVDTVDQGRRDLPVSAVKVKGAEVHIELGSFGAVYDGNLDSTGTQIVGLFRQAGANIPFNLKKTAQPPAVAAPLLPASYTPRNGSDLQGYWLGTVIIGPVKTRIAFKISDLGTGKYRAELDSVDQGATGIPVTSVSYQSPSVHMEVNGVAGTFDGTLSHSGEISGTWKQGPNNLPVVLKRGAPPAPDTADYRSVKDSEPQGIWSGALDTKGSVLRLVLKIGKQPNGTLVAKLDSPDQGANDIPAATIQFTAPSTLKIQWTAIAATFNADLKNNKLTGTWVQGGTSLPLVFNREKSK